MSTDATLRKAEKLAKSGDRAGAAALYQEVLHRFPANATAKAGLQALGTGAKPGSVQDGLTRVAGLLQRGQAKDAEALAQKVVAAYPEVPQTHALHAQAYAMIGQIEQAKAAFERAAELAPNDARLQIVRADTLISAGAPEAALAATKRAAELAPDLTDPLVLEARALSELKRDDEALERVETALAKSPKALNALLAKGNILSRLAQAEAAIAAFEAARDVAPNDPGVLNNLSNELARQERFDDAIALNEKALETAPGHPLLRRNLAQTLQAAGRARDALVVIDELVGDAPKGPTRDELRAQKITCLLELGERDTAKTLLDKLAGEAPRNLDVITTRATHFPASISEKERATLVDASRQSGLPVDRRVYLDFAIFRSNAAAGLPETAFDYLERSRALRETNAPFAVEQLEQTAKALEAQCRTGLRAPATLAPLAARPVFVAGLPRSGTTLAEQILSAHSMVHGAGEIIALTRAMKRIGWTFFERGKEFTVDTLAELRAGYGEQLAQLGLPASVVTDKTPLNVLRLGPALAAMPEARALILDRDPMAVCWSNYSIQLRGAANNFANTFENLARVYDLHVRLRDLWVEMYPDRVTVVSYSDLIDDPETGIRNVVAAAGLDWEDACLDFGKIDRSVRTASAGQVRDGIYKGSDAAWKTYETELAPLKEALAKYGY